jgi:hypothetical protein
MLDRNTGILRFDQPPLEIAPSLSRSEFLDSSASDGARISVKNEPWCSWVLAGRWHAGASFAVLLQFCGEQLSAVHLENADPIYGTSWDNWSEEKQLQRKAAHDHWLLACIGSRRVFPWGKVWSGFDPKGGFSSIVIAYSHGENSVPV